MNMHSLYRGETRYSMKGGGTIRQGGACDRGCGRWHGTPQAALPWVLSHLSAQEPPGSSYEERAGSAWSLETKVRAHVQRSNWAQRGGRSLRNKSKVPVSLDTKPHRIGL